MAETAGDLTLEGLEDILGHRFSDQKLLLRALTHASSGSAGNYERLEFLGDRVLGLVIAQCLYERFPDEMEGDLAKRLASLAEGSMLASLAAKINLGEYIIFSEAEKQAGGAENANILADVFESLIGAMYLDGGLEPCELFIKRIWDDVMDTMVKPPMHPKTALQEWAQGRALPLPTYEIVSQEGPDHAPVFDVAVNVQGYDPVVAQGRSRQEAEKQAAELFLTGIES